MDCKGSAAAQNTVAWPRVAEVKKWVESGFIVKAELRGRKGEGVVKNCGVEWGPLGSEEGQAGPCQFCCRWRRRDMI